MNITATLIGQSITFIIFVLFCMKYVWPALLSVMETRENRIATGLQAAEKADKDLELAKQKVLQQLKEAKQQAAVIIEQASRRADQIVEDATKQAVVDADRIKSAAQADLEREVARAREQLRGQVASLVLVGAEKVLGSSVDASSHQVMLEKLAAEM